MHARVQRNLCIGTANCVAIAPDVFSLDNRGLSTVVNTAYSDEAVLRESVDECPVQAIVLEDDDGKQIYP